MDLKKLALVGVVACIVAVGLASPASAEVAYWRTVATDSDRSSRYGTLALPWKQEVRIPYWHGLRTLVKAPRGKTRVGVDVNCWNPYTYESRSGSQVWRYWSKGRWQKWTHTIRDFGFTRCDVWMYVEGQNGYLTVKIQRLAD
jgi:hypothetical protein